MTDALPGAKGRQYGVSTNYAVSGMVLDCYECADVVVHARSLLTPVNTRTPAHPNHQAALSFFTASSNCFTETLTTIVTPDCNFLVPSLKQKMKASLQQ